MTDNESENITMSLLILDVPVDFDDALNETGKFFYVCFLLISLRLEFC